MSGKSGGMRKLGQLLTVALFAVALGLLYREVRHYEWDKIRAAFAALPTWQVVASVAMMIVNYLILIGYDWLALRAIGRNLPLHQVGLASWIGHATSFNFGALLGGTTVRYRLYSSWGLTGSEIVRMVAMLAVTFWFGVFALAGVLFVVDPLPVPEKLPLPGGSIQKLGLFLLLLTIAYLAVVLFWRRPVRLWRWELRFPRPSIAVPQLLVAAVDLAAAAACAYALMPPDFHLSFAVFLSVYLLAVVTVVFTHVPGGVGVFELTVITFAGQHDEALIAGLLGFRVIYYLAPLLSGAVVWFAYELLRRRTPTVESSP